MCTTQRAWTITGYKLELNNLIVHFTLNRDQAIVCPSKGYLHSRLLPQGLISLREEIKRHITARRHKITLNENSKLKVEKTFKYHHHFCLAHCISHEKNRKLPVWTENCVIISTVCFLFLFLFEEVDEHINSD